MLLYWYRLENLGNNFPLLHNAFAESKALYHSNQPSWYGTIAIILKLFKDENKTEVNLSLLNCVYKFKKTINAALKGLYTTEWKKQLEKLSDGKLKFYNICKTNLCCERYLVLIKKFELRRSFTRLRTSSHRLNIELGRYQGIPRHDRLCNKCSANVVEDELHFLLECSKFTEDRKQMLLDITNVCGNFKNLDNDNKLIWIFNLEDAELLKTVCKFISKNLP